MITVLIIILYFIIVGVIEGLLYKDQTLDALFISLIAFLWPIVLSAFILLCIIFGFINIGNKIGIYIIDKFGG